MQANLPDFQTKRKKKKKRANHSKVFCSTSQIFVVLRGCHYCVFCIFFFLIMIRNFFLRISVTIEFYFLINCQSLLSLLLYYFVATRNMLILVTY